MQNPFADAYETSLSSLSHHDWCVLSSRYGRGIDHFVEKLSKGWAIMGAEFRAFPIFKTKKAAYEAASKLILAESRWRYAKQWEAENRNA